MQKRRIFISLSPLLVFACMELNVFFPNLFYFFIVFANLILLSAMSFRLSGFGLQRSGSGIFFILPILFINSVALFSSILVRSWVIQLVYISLLFFLYLYFRYLPEDETDILRKSRLENVSSYGNFLIIFFFGSAIYGLQSFFNISSLIIILSWILVSSAVIYQVMEAGELDFKKNIDLCLFSIIVLTEIAWALTFLPFRYNVLGLILAVCYYMLIGLLRFYLRRSLTSVNIKLYLFFGFISIAILILSSRWI